MGIRETQNILG